MYDIVFVLTGQMEKGEDKYEFLPEDKSGFIHGEIRVTAAKILKQLGLVHQIISIGGPTEDGASKAKMMAELIGPGTIAIDTSPNTQGKMDEAKRFLEGKTGRFGVLTNFYHIPRTMRMAAENGLNLIPICAESVLLNSNSTWKKTIEEWYGNNPSMLKRILFEIQGLGDMEKGTYKN